LDTRYFRGLEGQYRFSLHFVLRELGSQTGDYVCRARTINGHVDRSISCEINLEKGQYEVVPQITAERRANKHPVEAVLPEYANRNPQKLRQVGLQYDLAHAKGGM
jgi:DNA-binding FrmR family transcriptional regulator